jgi:FkbM family methyltransferase
VNPRELVQRARAALRDVDAKLGTRLDTCLILGLQLAVRAPAGSPRLKFLALGVLYGTGRFDGPSEVRMPIPGGAATMRLPDHAAFLVLGEIFAMDQYRREPGPEPASILDLGANIGASALFYRRLHPDARIVCVEADPALAEVLRENTKLLDVEVIEAAVAAEAGELEFRQATQSWGGSIADGREGTIVKVPAVTLDELVERCRPDLIKIDVEGAEYDVLAASEQATTARIVVGEIHSGEHDPRTTALLDRFAGYRLDVEEYGDLTLFRAVRG